MTERRVNIVRRALLSSCSIAVSLVKNVIFNLSWQASVVSNSRDRENLKQNILLKS